MTTTARAELIDLSGQQIAVIGGGSGIGAAAARLLAQLGADVAAVSRTGNAPDHPRIRGVGLDANESGRLAELFESLPDLTHIVLTAVSMSGGPILSTPYEQIESTLRGWPRLAYEIARLAGKHLNPGGSVTYTSAGSAIRPYAGYAAAGAAAAAVEALTRQFAIELAPIRFNAVRPGPTDTPLLRGSFGDSAAQTIAGIGAGLPLGRIAQPEDVAHLIAALISSSYVSGAIVPVDGAGSLA